MAGARPRRCAGSGRPRRRGRAGSCTRPSRSGTGWRSRGRPRRAVASRTPCPARTPSWRAGRPAPSRGATLSRRGCARRYRLPRRSRRCVPPRRIGRRRATARTCRGCRASRSRTACAAAAGREAVEESRREHFAVACAHQVHERRKRLGVQEARRAAEDDERMPVVSFGRSQGHPGEAKHRQDVGVVPFERHGEREHVDVGDGQLRLQGGEAQAGAKHLRQLLLRRQEDAFAHRVVALVEEAVHGLEAEIRHADEVGVGERQCDPQTIAVRLADAANLAAQESVRPFALLPGAHGAGSEGSRAPQPAPNRSRCDGSTSGAGAPGCRGSS